jgi:hypothetical protein
VQAERIAAAHGARLVTCTCSDLAAEVTVEVDGSVLAGLPAPARARARAEVDFDRADAFEGRRAPAGANP